MRVHHWDFQHCHHRKRLFAASKWKVITKIFGDHLVSRMCMTPQPNSVLEQLGGTLMIWSQLPPHHRKFYRIPKQQVQQNPSKIQDLPQPQDTSRHFSSQPWPVPPKFWSLPCRRTWRPSSPSVPAGARATRAAPAGPPSGAKWPPFRTVAWQMLDDDVLFFDVVFWCIEIDMCIFFWWYFDLQCTGFFDVDVLLDICWSQRPHSLLAKAKSDGRLKTCAQNGTRRSDKTAGLEATTDAWFNGSTYPKEPGVVKQHQTTRNMHKSTSDQHGIWSIWLGTSTAQKWRVMRKPEKNQHQSTCAVHWQQTTVN